MGTLAPTTYRPDRWDTESVTSYASSSSGRRHHSDPEWDISKPALRRRAYARAGTDRFTRMVLDQDALAMASHQARQIGKHAEQAATRRMIDGEMDKLHARQAGEAEERAELRTTIAAWQARDESELAAEARARHERQLQTMRIFKGQVEEAEARAQTEREQADRTALVERAELAEEARQAREAKTREAVENRDKNERLKSELRAAVDRKAAEATQAVEDERAYNAACVRLMDEQEAARRAAVAKRAAKLQAAFERGGGVGIARDMVARARAEEEKAERQQVAFDAAEDARFAKLAADRQEAFRQQHAALKAMMEAKEEAAAREKAEGVMLKTRLEAERAVEHASEAEAARARGTAHAQLRAAQYADLLAENKKMFEDFIHRTPEREAVFHESVVTGRARAFNNLHVAPGDVAGLAATLRATTKLQCRVFPDWDLARARKG
ncbi:hypothetical protein FOA52_015723 [Chlamydomonas sp. UWO 241]|nr:hypothetical protein FOA52_015723 [Chlamydomonas sp. UWO 241]